MLRTIQDDNLAPETTSYKSIYPCAEIGYPAEIRIKPLVPKKFGKGLRIEKLRKGEETMIQRLKLAFEDLNCINQLG